MNPTLSSMFRKQFFILLVLLFCCCGTSKTKNTENEIIADKTDDEIVFIVFKMTKKTTGNTIEIISTTKSYGKMKSPTQRPVDNENHLTLEVFQNDQLVQTFREEHPLLKNVEYPDDNNQYVSKKVDLDEGEFFIRLQKKSGATKIKIWETIQNKPKKELQTFNL